MTETEEVVVALANGWSIRSGSDEYAAGDYVRVVDASGEERYYWDHVEWADEPVLVMGAILNVAARGGA